jgi:TPR repeat protein
MYSESKGVERDDAEAVKWFRKAADQDYTSAQNQLGMMYEQGRGVSQDYVKATEWYRKAAERGYGGAQNNLAIAYALGQGVPKDLIEASKWFALGAAHGDNQRADLRDAIQKELAPAQIAETEKRVKEFRPGK